MRNRSNVHRHSAGTRKARIAYQETADNTTTTPDNTNAEGTEESTEKQTTDVANEFGVMRKGTFSINVFSDEKDEKGDKKVLYENDKEPFEYQVCDSLGSVFNHMGSKLTDEEREFIGKSLTSTEAELDKARGEAVKKLVTIYNNKLKSDAKSARYQALVNQYKPLEGEKLETAQARTISLIIKQSGMPKEVVIEMLKSNKVLPADYTVADFDATPLRRTKGEAEEE